ncbi:FCD domain-containing protein [Rhodoblastus sp.]|uniref:FCD domain-containing protein n=1 Tax=Rhodoblastus sp. TaxID=1962975 RepID=UPI00260C087F|nr:FCD domain-containing protein [Rhodoblastus sp.]
MDPLRTPKLADALVEHLEQLILEGALRPGEKLAPERELAAKLDVSRPSLREALDKLHARGLIETNKAGNFVSQFLTPMIDPLTSLFQSSEQAVKDYLEYRCLIEGEAARLAAIRATDVERDAIARCLEKLRDAHDANDLAAEADTDAELHMLIYEAAHNLVLLHIMRALYEMLRSDAFYNRRQLYAKEGSREVLLTQHFAIAEAILARDPEAAAAAATAHIEGVAHTLREMQEEETRVARAMRRMGRAELLARPTE